MLVARAHHQRGNVPNHNERLGNDNRHHRPDNTVVYLAYGTIRVCCAIQMKMCLLKSGSKDQQYRDEYNPQIPHQRRLAPDLVMLPHT